MDRSTIPQLKLSAEREREVRAKLRELGELLPHYDQLEKCGTNCDVYRDETYRIREQLEQLLAYYGSQPANPVVG